MARLRGDGLGVGIALGTAAVVRERDGIALLPEIPARIAREIAARRLAETPEVILVAEDYRRALAVAPSLSWAKVIGIVAGDVSGEIPAPTLPAVVGVPQATEAVEDDMLLLLDAARGIVLIEPDMTVIAQYQAEAEHIAPKRRLFLEDVHLPAQTLDGHTIQIIANVTTEEEITTALDAGADALAVPFDTPLLLPNTDEITLQDHLNALIDLAASKPLILFDDYALPPDRLLEVASRADLTVAVPPRPDLEGLGLAEIREEWKAAEAECLENEMACGAVRLAVDIIALPEEEDPEQISAWVERLAAQGATQLIFSMDCTSLTEPETKRLDWLLRAATGSLLHCRGRISLFSYEDAALTEAVSTLIGLGMTGLIVGSEGVQRTKETIRESNLSECREAILKALYPAEGGG